MATHLSNDTRRLLSASRRTGGITVLMLFVITAVTAFCMFTINTAYMEMATMDLQTATDLAAKAGAQELGRTQNYGRSMNALRRHLQLHRFGQNQPIQFVRASHGGMNEDPVSGRIQFDPTRPRGAFTSALQVRGRYPRLFGDSTIPFPVFDGRRYVIETDSIAGRTDVDLVLCLDRSASMAWDLSNVPFRYPNGTKGLDNYFRPPMEGSRWGAVSESVDTLVEAVSTGRVPGEVNIGLVTFASQYQFGIFESTQASIDMNLTRDGAAITNALEVIGSQPIIGDTNINAGLNLVSRCRNRGSVRRLTGQPILVLLTDGLYTEGGSPVDRARALANQGWTIHTISFSRQADQDLMRQLAEIGSGNHYHAPNKDALLQAFRDIAFNLPGTLIQ